jgi:hypothetical protein
MQPGNYYYTACASGQVASIQASVAVQMGGSPSWRESQYVDARLAAIINSIAQRLPESRSPPSEAATNNTGRPSVVPPFRERSREL